METGSRARIEKLIANIDQLPTLPMVYTRLQNMLSDPKVSAKDVGAVLEQDLALAAKILKVVNSSYYGFPKRVTTISHAVVILGFNEIKHLALSISLIKMFGDGPASSFDQKEFWKHCLAVAVCSGVIARKATQAKTISHEEAFVAGLLHDIGKIIEDQFMHDEFSRALKASAARSTSLYEEEKSVFGITHQEIGEFLTGKWRLPELLQMVAGFHHQPAIKKANQEIFLIVSIVHCADVLVRGLAIGSSGDPFVPRLAKESWSFLGFSTTHVRPIIDDTERMYADMAKMMLDAG